MLTHAAPSLPPHLLRATARVRNPHLTPPATTPIARHAPTQNQEKPLPTHNPSSSLDSPQISVDVTAPDALNEYETLKEHPLNIRHRTARTAIHRAMSTAAVATRRRRNFATCGTGWWLMKSLTDAHTYKLVRDWCHDRLCPLCSQRRAANVHRHIAAALDPGDYRLITLTVHHNDNELRHQLQRLVAAFRKLRSTRGWKDHVQGGIAALEFTFNATTNRWHPHLHVLALGSYYPHAMLRDAWKKATGDSDIVHLAYVRSRTGAANYVAKYVAKPAAAAANVPDQRLPELITALAGTHLLIRFGSLHAMKLDDPREPSGYKCVCHSTNLLLETSLDEHTLHALAAIIRGFPNDHETQPIHIGPPPPDPTDHMDYGLYNPPN